MLGRRVNIDNHDRSNDPSQNGSAPIAFWQRSHFLIIVLTGNVAVNDQMLAVVTAQLAGSVVFLPAFWGSCFTLTPFQNAEESDQKARPKTKVDLGQIPRECDCEKRCVLNLHSTHVLDFSKSLAGAWTWSVSRLPALQGKCGKSSEDYTRFSSPAESVNLMKIAQMNCNFRKTAIRYWKCKRTTYSRRSL
jgi:hypothetical protein